MEHLRMAERKAKLDLIGLGQSMKPWRINHGTDNTRERSLCRKFPGPLSREGLTLSRVSPYRTILADHVVVRLNRSSR